MRQLTQAISITLCALSVAACQLRISECETDCDAQNAALDADADFRFVCAGQEGQRFCVRAAPLMVSLKSGGQELSDGDLIVVGDILTLTTQGANACTLDLPSGETQDVLNLSEVESTQVGLHRLRCRDAADNEAGIDFEAKEVLSIDAFRFNGERVSNTFTQVVGQALTLSWELSTSARCALNGVDIEGAQVIVDEIETNYELRCQSDPSQEVSQSVEVVFVETPLADRIQFNGVDVIDGGVYVHSPNENLEITWRSLNADSCTLFKDTAFVSNESDGAFSATSFVSIGLWEIQCNRDGESGPSFGVQVEALTLPTTTLNTDIVIGGTIDEPTTLVATNEGVSSRECTLVVNGFSQDLAANNDIPLDLLNPGLNTISTQCPDDAGLVLGAEQSVRFVDVNAFEAQATDDDLGKSVSLNLDVEGDDCGWSTIPETPINDDVALAQVTTLFEASCTNAGVIGEFIIEVAPVAIENFLPQIYESVDGQRGLGFSADIEPQRSNCFINYSSTVVPEERFAIAYSNGQALFPLAPNANNPINVHEPATINQRQEYTLRCRSPGRAAGFGRSVVVWGNVRQSLNAPGNGLDAEHLEDEGVWKAPFPQAIVGSLAIIGQSRNFNDQLSALVDVRGPVLIQNNSGAEAIAFPLLRRVMSQVQFVNNEASAIRMPLFESTRRLRFGASPMLTNLELPLFTRVQALEIDDADTVALIFDDIGVATLELPSLRAIEGTLLARNNAGLIRFEAPRLIRAIDRFEVNNNDELLHVDLTNFIRLDERGADPRSALVRFEGNAKLCTNGARAIAEDLGEPLPNIDVENNSSDECDLNECSEDRDCLSPNTCQNVAGSMRCR